MHDMICVRVLVINRGGMRVVFDSGLVIHAIGRTTRSTVRVTDQGLGRHAIGRPPQSMVRAARAVKASSVRKIFVSDKTTNQVDIVAIKGITFTYVSLSSSSAFQEKSASCCAGNENFGKLFSLCAMNCLSFILFVMMITLLLMLSFYVAVIIVCFLLL